MKKYAWLLLVSATLALAMGPAPRYIEELRVGGGYSDAFDGGADFEKNGTITTNGSIVTDADVLAGGDAALGANEAADHQLSVTAGSGHCAALNLFQANTTNGGAVWYDGTADTLKLGTRNGSATPAAAIEIPKGGVDIALPGDLDVQGGDVRNTCGNLCLTPNGGGAVIVASDLEVNGGKLDIDAAGDAEMAVDRANENYVARLSFLTNASSQWRLESPAGENTLKLQRSGTGSVLTVGANIPDGVTFTAWPVFVNSDFTVRGDATLGDAPTDAIACAGRLLLRSVNDADMNDTAGTAGEIVFNIQDSTFYGCTASGNPASWAALH